MKLTSRKYAQALVEVLGAETESALVIKNFLVLLRKRKQMRLLPKILQIFEELWNEKQGIVKLEVTHPSKFASSAVELAQILEQALGKKVEMHLKSADDLLGGFKVKFGDTMIDASLKGKLNALSKKLTG